MLIVILMMNDVFEVRPLELDEELERFKNELDKAVEKDAGSLIFNEGFGHAALLLSKMFDKAEKYVYIYADTLRDELTQLDKYFCSLERCLKDENIEVRFLLSPYKEGKSKFRDYLRNHSYPNVEVHSLDNVAELMSSSIEDNAHFTIVDDKIFRAEYDIKNFKALASFNFPEYTGQLKSAYLDIYPKAARES